MPSASQDRATHASACKCFISAARGSVVLFALAATALTASAAKNVTVAELEQTLTAGHSLPDAALAQRLSDLELTERLSTARLAQLEASLPGDKSRQALMMVADPSAFLDPPAAELPAAPAPDVAAQRKILGLTIEYVTQTVRQFPNFLATRVTTSFEDTPSVQRPGVISSQGMQSATAYQPLHLVAVSSVTVSYRDGHETLEAVAVKDPKQPPPARTLSTSGVFGPILGTVLVDAARGKLEWSHWEQGQTGLQAVFTYEVPRDKSHYTVTWDSLPTTPAGGCSTKTEAFSQIVAYHGEMAIDPNTGAILRLVLVADLKPGDFTAKSGIVAEYGQVEIGGKSYFLPVKSVSSTLAHYVLVRRGDCSWLELKEGLKTSLNDVTFEQYHMFGSESRMLSAKEAEALESQPAPAPALGSATQFEQASVTPPPSSIPAQAPPAEQPAATPSVAGAPQVSTPTPGNATAPAPANNQAQAEPESQPKSVPVFKTTARQVLVDVVVDKKNGDPVSGLPQSDFSIAEDNKPQSIDFFEVHSADASAPVAQPAMPPLPPGAVTNVPTAAPSAALYVFLLDSLNTEPQDQVFIHEQVLSFLHKMDPGTQVAVFSLGSSLHILQGFTSDSATLLAAVSGKGAVRDAMAQNRSDNADDAAHIANLQSMRASGAAIEARQAADAAAHAYSFGARSSMTFEALSALARYLEGIPGRKNLIWFASSFPVVFFPTPQQLDQLKTNQNVPGYMNHVKQTANLFTLSKIAVYPVSGAGVMNSNVGLADSADAGSAGGTGHFGTSAGPTNSLAGEALGSASATTAMEQLAASTGGRAFTTNDIGAALRRIIHDSATYYTLGYAPSDVRTDSGFRRIEVRVNPGKYKLSYRQGYNAGSAVTAPAGGSAPVENPITPLLNPGLPAATGILYGVRAAEQAPQQSAAPQASNSTPGTGAGSETKPAGQNPNLHGPTTRYTVSFTIRAQDVSFDQAPNGVRAARLLIGLKGYGHDGAALNWQATREAIELTPPQYEEILKSGIPVDIDIDLPAQTPAQLVTAVYDWNTSRAGTLEIPLHP